MSAGNGRGADRGGETADRLFVDPAMRRIVTPVVNGGGGLAITVGLPLIVSDCADEPMLLPSGSIGRPGTYVIRSGEPDQLGYVEPSVPTGGSVHVGRASYS